MRDNGFRLCILNALIENGRVEKETLEQFLAERAEGKIGPDTAADDEGASVQKALEILGQFPISVEDWASIRSLCVDGGDLIYFVIEDFLDICTGGESDHYLYGSIDEAAKCENLMRLCVGIYAQPDRPLPLDCLAGLTHLTHVGLDGFSFSGTSVLAGLPSLAEFTFYGKLDMEPAGLDALRARGVRVTAR
jgi:hypothetical protein